MASVLLVIFIFAEALFFSVAELIGIKTGEGSNTYTLYFMMLSGMIIVSIFWNFINKNIKMTKVNFLILIVILMFLLVIVYYYYKFEGAHISNLNLKYFIGMVLPGMVLVLSLSEEQIMGSIKYIKYINIIVMIGFVWGFINISDEGMFGGIGGTNHLTVGYNMCALYAYNISNFILRRGKKGGLSCGFAAINALFVVLSGARGPLISLVVISGLVFFCLRTELKSSKIVKKSIFFTVASTSAIFILSTSVKFQRAYERILSLFGLTPGVGTSGRNILYEKAIELIGEKPVVGHGIGGYAYYSGENMYPHNIFLETWCDLGIIGLLVAICLFIVLAIKICKNLFFEKGLAIYSLLLVNVMVQIMFSVSYVYTFQFWILTYIILSMPSYKRECVKY